MSVYAYCFEPKKTKDAKEAVVEDKDLRRLMRVPQTMLVCGLLRYQNRSASIGSAMEVSNVSNRILILKTLQ